METALTESEIRFFTLILRIIASAPSGIMNETQIIEFGLKSEWLTWKERCSVPSRTDTRFANGIHNQISHRSSRKNLIRQRLISWEPVLQTLEITDRGWNFLNRVDKKLRGLSSSQPLKENKDFNAIDQWLKKYPEQQSQA